MDIQMAVLCDFAADYGGKFCVQGCFDTLYARELPYIKRDFTLAFRATMMSEDNGRYELGVSIVDEDGVPLDQQKMPFHIEVNVAVPAETEFVTRNYILNCYGLQFNNAGEYSMDLTIDGELIVRVPFRIRVVAGKEALKHFHRP